MMGVSGGRSGSHWSGPDVKTCPHGWVVRRVRDVLAGGWEDTCRLERATERERGEGVTGMQ